MDEPLHLLPHTERLLRRLEALEDPLVQVWGWPGAGKSALLRALCEKQGPRARGLSLGELSREGKMREALEAAHEAGVRWLVVSGRPGEALEEAAVWLRPGQQLVFAVESRWVPSSLACAVLPPQEMLLDPREVATLWYLLTGGELDAAGAGELCEASDGWYRPLRLALDATGGVGLDRPTPEQLLEVSPVRYFLRHEVLDSFSTEERDLLLTAPPENDERDDSEESWRLLDVRGLWIEGEGRDRLPRLLAAFLERERERRGTAKAASSTSRSSPAPEPPPRTGAARPVYRLGLLGSPVAQLRDAQGERPLDWRLKRSFQILAFLGSSPDLEATREELIEAIWPTEGERTIERNFHPTLSHLRRALEGDRKGSGPAPLLFRNGIYRLNPEITWEIDVLDFDRHIETGKEQARPDPQAAAESWSTAWKLYRGPFLQGHYEAWITARREDYQRKYLEMLRDLGGLYVRLGKTEEAMDAYRSVLMEDPLQEKVHLEVMLLYAKQGRRDLVRRQYDRLCMLLLEELGVEPMQKTTEEYHKLMG